MSVLKSLLGKGKTQQPEQPRQAPASSPQAAAGQLDLLTEQMQAAENEYDFAKADEIGSAIRAMGAPAVDRLLSIALDDSTDLAFGHAVIELLGKMGDQRVVQPLFARFMRRRDPATLAQTDAEAFGLYREAQAALEALGSKVGE